MKIGLVASAFDLLHPGHLLLLKDAKDQCDQLVVALHVDPSIERSGKSKPIQTVFERYLQLEACKYPNYIIVYETEQDLLNIMKIFDINVIILGSEYKNTKYTGSSLNIETYFHNRNHDFSSTELRKRL